MSRKGEAMLKEKIFELFWSHDSLSKAEVMTALSQEVSDASVKRAFSPALPLFYNIRHS